jgi:hypothetical protein
MLNLAGRDKCGYYHELFLRGKHFLSYRIQRLKIKGKGVRKPSSPETEPDFYYDAPYLPSTRVPIRIQNPQVSLVSNMLASVPNTLHLDTRGSLSLDQPFVPSTFAASLLHQAQFAPPPLFYTNTNHLLQAQAQAQAHAHLQQLRMVSFPPEMQMVGGFGQYHISQDDSTAAVNLALSRVEQDRAALAMRNYYR